MTFKSLLAVRPVRAMQSAVAVEEQTEEAAAAERTRRIEYLKKMIPAEDEKIAAALSEEKNGEDELEASDREETACDGSPDSLDAIERRRRAARFHVRRGREVREHHTAIRDEAKRDLATLEAAEQHARDVAELRSLETRGAEVVEQLAALYRAYIAALVEYQKFGARWPTSALCSSTPARKAVCSLRAKQLAARS